MAKKTHNKKDSGLNSTQPENESNTKSLSKLANNKIEESLKNFSKISQKERETLFGNKNFFEQFWLFFKEEHPNLLDEIDSQEKLIIYVQNLEKKGFDIGNIMKNKEIHEEFKETIDEKTTITQSLKQLQEYCNNGENKMPADIFKNFANDIKLEISPVSITKKTKISKLGNLFSVRTNYLEDNGIVLKDHQKSEAEKILCPSYLPTERLLISATIKKLKKNIPDNLLADFESYFPLPIDIHSPFETLKSFSDHRIIFLDANKTQIDENLAKKLDKIIITNGDIYQELQYEGEKIEWTKGFSEQTKNFRRIFNKLATRQLFEEAKETGAYISHHFEQVGNEFKTFPPYFNELLNIYPYKHQTVIQQQPAHKETYNKQEQLLTEKEKEFEQQNLSEQQKEEVKQDILNIKKELNNIRRKAYVDYIKTQDREIGAIIGLLVDNNFDMNKLSSSDQQKIINILASSKLEDSTKNQIPNILGIDSNEYQTFIKNLFDLNNKEVSIPTQYGDIKLDFLEKRFLGGPTKDLMEITSNGEALSEQKNLPLNFKVKITEQNKSFFEDNILFEDLFSDFNSKNNLLIQLNDSYKIRITNKEGKFVEGYLSEYPPTEEIKKSIDEGKSLKPGRFLYSHPITRPEDTREVLTWDGKTEGDPVVILKDEESNYDIDILSKEINLNGEAISALLFSYPLGQYNIKNNLSKDQEKKLAEKFGKIEKENIYHDTIDNHDKEESQKSEKIKPEEDQEKVKEKDKKDFLEERKTLKGHQEDKEDENNGFKKGAKLLIQLNESGFKPDGSYQYFTAEVTNIDEEKGTFKIRFNGNEQNLGQREGKEKEFSLNKKGLQKIKEIFEDKIYKLPSKEINNDINTLLPALTSANIDGIQPNESFKEVNRNGNNFTIDIGKEKGEKVTHFGLVETRPGEDLGKESKIGYMYEIHHEPLKKKFKIIANDKEKTTIHLDYPNFILFVSSRKLQPQTAKTSKGIEVINQEGTEVKGPKRRKGYSFASIIGLVKNFGKKIGDGLKKYEDEQTEDLTDHIFSNGKLFYALGKIMPTDKWKEAFENAGHEYRQERDNKVFKKIESYLAFYEKDPDFGSPTSWSKQVEPYLRGDKKFRDHHQAAAMLIATIKKGKGPYSRNTDRAGKGMRIKMLLGEEHQKRYLFIKEKLERELQQGYKAYGQNWADDRQNEILKLEMKYLIDSIDGRHLQYRPDTAKFEAMYSKKFACDMLETESNKFFSETVSSSTKEKNYSFELARFEYFRLLGDRPQQAIPNLKQMALKAISPLQRDALKNAILTGMLSGVFYNISQEDKKFIQRISRSFGFLPGLLIRDPNHHQKIAQLIEISTGEKIKYKKNKETYNSDLFGFGKMKNLGQAKDFVDYDKGVSQRLLGTNEKGKKRLDLISDFVGRKQNAQGKTLIEILNDDKTSNTDKTLLQEFYNRSLEKNENLDTDVHNNGKILEQNILTKNQSHINEIIGFENGSFKGKDEDDRQNKADARKTISTTLPRNKLNDKNEIISYIQMFMNRFEDKGFNTEEKRFLIRTLSTLKNNKNDPSADEMLRYAVVGNIIRNSGHGQAPDQLVSGLEAVKDFFENNLETIIQSDVIEKGFGHIFLEELDKKPYKIAPWEEYVDLKINRQHMVGRSKEENQIRGEKRRLYEAEEIYINSKIYNMAEQIYNRNYIPNKFKKYYDPETKKTTTKEELHKTLDKKSINIKNPQTIDKIERILSGQKKEGLSEEEIIQMEQGNEDWYE